MSETQYNRPASAQEDNNSLNLKDLLFLYLSKWRWFVLSLGVCVCAAVLYLLYTPSVYTRTATLLIEDNDKGGSISQDMNFSDLGLFQSNTNVNNEIIAISSPALMQKVVQRLRLYMNYSAEGRFHDNVLYGTSLPVTVEMSGVPESRSASLTLRLEADSTVTMYGFATAVDGKTVKYKDVTASGRLGEAVETPLGTVTVKPTLFYAPEGKEIYVSKSSLYGATSSYSSKLKASLLQKEATVVSLSIEDVSIQRADDVLNTLISAYNESWVEAKNQIAVSTSAFIDDRLRVIEQELGVVEEDISTYKSENLISDMQAASDLYVDQSSKAEIQIMEINNRLYMVRYILDYMQRDANEFQILPAGTGIESSSIESQIAAYNTLLLERNSLVANSSTSNPLVVDRDNALNDMRGAIVKSLNNYTVMLETQLETLRRQEAEATGKIAAAPDQTKYLLSVERQQKVKESLYLFLLQKREENELSQAFTAYNTRLITPPTGSTAPTSPASRMVLLVAIVLGLAIPMGAFFAIEMSDTRLRGKKDLENLSVPYIGEIPLAGKPSRKMSLHRLPELAKGKRKGESNAVSIVVREGQRDVINEAFRVVRTNMEFMTSGSPGSNVYIVTSFNVGSGKSFITANLAVSMAIKGRKVLVIDGDLRKATISRVVGRPKSGFTDWLAGRVEDVNPLIVPVDGVQDLYMLPCGTIPPNPAELLMDERLRGLIDDLKGQYDSIFIDCPPINMVADAQIMSKVADRTIFIVRAGLLERGMLPELENDYREGKYPNMCMLLNGTVSKGSYGYRYGYRYGYNYGYGYYG